MQPHPDDDDLIALLYPESLDPETRASLEQRVSADAVLADRLATWRATLSATRRASRLPEPPPGVRAHVLREARAHAEGRLRSRAAAAAAESTPRGWFAGFGSIVVGAFGVALAIGGAAVMSTDQAPEAALSPERVAAAPVEPAADEKPADEKPVAVVAAASTPAVEPLTDGLAKGEAAAAPIGRAKAEGKAQAVAAAPPPEPFPGVGNRGAAAEKSKARLVAQETDEAQGAPPGAAARSKKAGSPAKDESYAEAVADTAAPAAAGAPPAPAPAVAARRAEARSETAAAPAEESKAASSLVLARTALAALRWGEAARLYDAALVRPAPGDAPRGVVLIEAAEAYAALGDFARASALLRQSIAAGGPQVERARAQLDALEGARREAARPRPVEEDAPGSTMPADRASSPQSLPASPLP